MTLKSPPTLKRMSWDKGLPDDLFQEPKRQARSVDVSLDRGQKRVRPSTLDSGPNNPTRHTTRARGFGQGEPNGNQQGHSSRPSPSGGETSRLKHAFDSLREQERFRLPTFVRRKPMLLDTVNGARDEFDWGSRDKSSPRSDIPRFHNTNPQRFARYARTTRALPTRALACRGGECKARKNPQKHRALRTRLSRPGTTRNACRALSGRAVPGGDMSGATPSTLGATSSAQPTAIAPYHTACAPTRVNSRDSKPLRLRVHAPRQWTQNVSAGEAAIAFSLHQAARAHVCPSAVNDIR